MRYLLAGLLTLLITTAQAADNTVIITPGVGVTLRSRDIGSGVESLQQILGDTSGNALATAPGTPNGSFALPIQGVTGGTSVPVTVNNTNANGFAAPGNASPVVGSPACTKVINISQTATTDVHTFTNLGYICSIVLISATAQNIGVDEGTGTTCETSGTALVGVSSTSGATPSIAVAANGGFSAISGAPWLVTQTSADHLCVLQSGGGNVSGTITYLDHT